jgi:aryl-alcohol dehydrogenase-like predicted oxidoreductase
MARTSLAVRTLGHQVRGRDIMRRRDFVKAIAALSATGLTSGTQGAERPSHPPGENVPVPRRQLGQTGVEVSCLGLGGVIGMQLPPSQSHDPVALAEMALDLGVTYLDTAPSYNRGQSELNYGRALQQRRNEVFLATKTEERTYDGTMKGVEQSLARLRTDHVDLLQIHAVGPRDDPRSWASPRGVLTALQKLREQKVIRFFGVTGHDSAEALRQAIEMYEFDTPLTTLNPVDRRRPFREGLLAAASRKGMGIIAMKVMGGGNGCLVAGNPVRKVLRPYHDDTVHQVDAAALIRYTLGLPIAAALIGVASPAQLTANVHVVREAKFMSLVDRQKLERLVS